MNIWNGKITLKLSDDKPQIASRVNRKLNTDVKLNIEFYHNRVK